LQYRKEEAGGGKTKRGKERGLCGSSQGITDHQGIRVLLGREEKYVAGGKLVHQDRIVFSRWGRGGKQ